MAAAPPNKSSIARYLAVGIVNTAIGYAVILGLERFGGMTPYMANTASYVIGITASYFLNRRYTFSSVRAHAHAAPLFAVAAAASFALNP